MAIKRSIKGQAQEIALHMGETATVADILKRFEMMFGDVNPPHVLLAQFYAAEQHPGESVTDWYARIEDIASKIIRKDSTVISPNNYDVIVNTQFWTKMQDDRIKSALRHKFDMLSGSPQFIIEARKIESECKMETVRVQQAHIEVSPTIQEGLDSLLSRLVSLEDKPPPPPPPPLSSKAENISDTATNMVKPYDVTFLKSPMIKYSRL